MRPGLLLVRVPQYKSLGLNAEVRGRYNVIVLNVSDEKPEEVDGYHALPIDSEASVVETKVEEIVKASSVELAVVMTPLSEYGEAAARVLRRMHVPFFWSEVFPNGKLVLDRFGVQYTRRNEITAYEDIVQVMEPDLPIGTRFPQPPAKTTQALYARYGEDAIPVFGQVPFDNSLKDPDSCLPYYDWLDAVFTGNPDTKFLFKQHPAARKNPQAATLDLERYKNVVMVDEAVGSIFEAYKHCVAYNSTVVIEGASRGVSFLTGGRHFLDMDEVVLRPRRRTDLEGAIGRLRDFKVDKDRLKNRLGFITRFYALDPLSPRIADRLTMTSLDFFKKGA